MPLLSTINIRFKSIAMVMFCKVYISYWQWNNITWLLNKNNSKILFHNYDVEQDIKYIRKKKSKIIHLFWQNWKKTIWI